MLPSQMVGKMPLSYTVTCIQSIHACRAPPLQLSLQSAWLTSPAPACRVACLLAEGDLPWVAHCPQMARVHTCQLITPLTSLLYVLQVANLLAQGRLASSKHIASNYPASAHDSWLLLGQPAACLTLASHPAGGLPARVRQPAQQSGAGPLGGGSGTPQRSARGCGECDRGAAPRRALHGDSCRAPPW